MTMLRLLLLSSVVLASTECMAGFPFLTSWNPFSREACDGESCDSCGHSMLKCRCERFKYRFRPVCSCYPEVMPIHGPFYGYHATCWRRLPECPCPQSYQGYGDGLDAYRHDPYPTFQPQPEPGLEASPLDIPASPIPSASIPSDNTSSFDEETTTTVFGP